MEEATLNEQDIRLFQGTFRDEAGHQTEVPMIPQELIGYTKKQEVAKRLEKIDLHGYFEGVHATVDCKRVYELITSIKEDGQAEITNLSGEKRQVQITVQLVADALNLTAKDDLVTKRREEVKVYRERKTNYTYEDLQDPQVEILCRLYNQFLHVCTKRPQKYITPPSAIATTFTWAVQMSRPQEVNYAQYIHSQIVKMGDKGPKYIGAGEMLTKIAYEAIGA